MFTKSQIMSRKSETIGVILLVSSIVSCEIAGALIEKQAYAHHDTKYITAIEDRSSEPAGFMVMTADYNYAICSPRLHALNWQSITVNDAQVVIVTKKNTTLITGLFKLNEHERDFIAEIRGEFLQNLAGLKLSQSKAGSLFVSKKSGYLQSHLTGGGGESTYASSAISLLRDDATSYLSGTQRHAAVDMSGGGLVVNETVTSNEENGDRRALTPSGDSVIDMRKRKQQRPMKAARAQTNQIGNVAAAVSRAAEPKNETRPLAVRSYKPPPSYTTSTGPTYYHHNYQQQQQQQQAYGPRYSFVPAKRPDYNRNQCSHRVSPANFNYYNLNGQLSSLVDSLCGDIYNFDLRCNVLDVYSKSVLVLNQLGVSILYRDHNYFAYSRSNYPLQINRLFLVGDKVFFVYNDGSLLLKHSWLLTPLELHTVTSTRRHLQAVVSSLQASVSRQPAAAAQESANSTSTKEAAKVGVDGSDDNNNNEVGDGQKKEVANNERT